MAMESAIFRHKSLTNFLTLTHQISLLADFTHFEQPFSLQISKTTYSAPFTSFSYVFKIQVNLAEVSLKHCHTFTCFSFHNIMYYELKPVVLVGD